VYLAPRRCAKEGKSKWKTKKEGYKWRHVTQGTSEKQLVGSRIGRGNTAGYPEEFDKKKVGKRVEGAPPPVMKQTVGGEGDDKKVQRGRGSLDIADRRQHGGGDVNLCFRFRE